MPEEKGTWHDLSEVGKLAVLDFWVDYDGVSLRDRQLELTRHVDAAKLPAEVAEQLLNAPGENLNVSHNREPKQKDRGMDRDR